MDRGQGVHGATLEAAPRGTAEDAFCGGCDWLGARFRAHWHERSAQRAESGQVRVGQRSTWMKSVDGRPHHETFLALTAATLSLMA